MTWEDFKLSFVPWLIVLYCLFAAYKIGYADADRKYGQILFFIISHPQVVPKLAADYNEMFNHQEDYDFSKDPFQVKRFGRLELDNQDVQGLVRTGDYGGD